MKKNLNNNSFNGSASNVEDMVVKRYYSGETVAYKKFIINGLNAYTVMGETYNDVEKFLNSMTMEFSEYYFSLCNKVAKIDANKLRKVDVERLKEFIAVRLLASLYEDEDRQLEYWANHNEKGNFYRCDILLQSESIQNKEAIVSKMKTKDFCSIELTLPNDFTVSEVKKFLTNIKK